MLVVDDDRLIRELLGEALTEDGYEVTTASNGSEALDVLSRWRPDVIVLDLLMPVMDGPTFRARQLEMDGAATVPILLLTASRDLDLQRQALRVEGAMQKPFDLDAVMDKIASMIAG